MNDPARVPDDDLDALIDPELRAEIGDPVPVTFAATLVYVPLLLAGLAASWWLTGSLSGPAYAPARIALDLLLGAAIALSITAATFGLARRVQALQELEIEFRRVLGHLGKWQIFRLAALSGAAEELVFRGAIQPLIADDRFLGWGDAHGVVWTSLFFGLLHFLPHKVFLPWTIFAGVVGFLCGLLFVERGSLVAPIALHVVLNAVNLRLIVSGRRLPPGADTPSSATPSPR
ncbi:MAG TPA: CPBP family intramembrane glutamic endopeptidase [Planctomycetota bacterium]|nr:CPBP family intramembrane glutamic endopeptidase [Planctomycetota bacterium]